MVKIKVDMENREKLRRLHTTTHIVNFSARQVLGNHVWQNGSNLKPEFGTLDITHYDNVTLEQIFQIEKIANKVVFENKKVSIEELERSDAEKKYGFTIYQGGAIPMKKLRVIKVLDSDVEACGGLHMLSTGGIGLIKIIEAQKIQDGVVRLKYVVNEYALDEIAKKQRALEQVRETFNVDESSVVKTSQKFFNEWKEQKKDIDKLKEKLKETYLKMIKSSKEHEFSFDEDFDMGFIMELFSEANKLKPKLKIESLKFILATPDFKVKEAKKQIPKGNFTIYIK